MISCRKCPFKQDLKDKKVWNDLDYIWNGGNARENKKCENTKRC